MFDQERTDLETRIRTYLTENGIPVPEDFLWVPVPFSGEWGISTSFFAVAAQEARSGKKVIVPQRAQEIAEGVKAFLILVFVHIDDVRVTLLPVTIHVDLDVQAGAAQQGDQRAGQRQAQRPNGCGAFAHVR